MSCFGAIARVLKIFLIEPSERNFSILFPHLVAFTQAHLYSAKSSGRKLPDQYSDFSFYLKSLASDIITNIVCDEYYPRYQKIFNIFKSKGITSFETHDEYELFIIFSPAFKKLINQEIFDIPKEYEPQIANLIKQIKRAVNSSCYKVNTNNIHHNLIGYDIYIDNPRLEKDPIPVELFESIVLESFNSEECTTRPKWLKLIFDKVNKLTEYQNIIDKSILISTCIKINSKHLESEEFAPKPLSSIVYSAIKLSIEKAHQETLKLINNNHLQHFIDNNKISESEKGTLELAVDNFLRDFGYNGGYDKFPRYFRELVETESNKYQTDYKHIIDTIFRKALEIFKEKLRNDPTIIKFGRYFIE